MRDLILIYHFLFFHFLYSYDLIGLPVPTYSYFSEGTTANYLYWYEVFYGQFGSLQPIILTLLMQYLLLNELLFLLTQLHTFHLLSQFVPSLFPFTFLIFGLSVFVFNIWFGRCSFFTSGGAAYNLRGIRWRILCLPGGWSDATCVFRGTVSYFNIVQ